MLCKYGLTSSPNLITLSFRDHMHLDKLIGYGRDNGNSPAMCLAMSAIQTHMLSAYLRRWLRRTALFLWQLHNECCSSPHKYKKDFPKTVFLLNNFTGRTCEWSCLCITQRNWQVRHLENTQKMHIHVSLMFVSNGSLKRQELDLAGMAW